MPTLDDPNCRICLWSFIGYAPLQRDDSTRNSPGSTSRKILGMPTSILLFPTTLQSPRLFPLADCLTLTVILLPACFVSDTDDARQSVRLSHARFCLLRDCRWHLACGFAAWGRAIEERVGPESPDSAASPLL